MKQRIQVRGYRPVDPAEEWAKEVGVWVLLGIAAAAVVVAQYPVALGKAASKMAREIVAGMVRRRLSEWSNERLHTWTSYAQLEEEEEMRKNAESGERGEHE